MSQVVSSKLLQVIERRSEIKKLAALRTAIICTTEREIFDLLLEKEVAELNDWEELLVNMQQL